MRIVLVEDNDGDVRLLEKALQARSIAYELVRYEDGAQAIREISAESCSIPDLILLDLNVPLKDGFDVLRKIRMTPRLVGVPIGILTSSDATRDRNRGFLIGIDRYIHKPPLLEEFVEHVGKAIDELLSLRI